MDRHHQVLDLGQQIRDDFGAGLRNANIDPAAVHSVCGIFSQFARNRAGHFCGGHEIGIAQKQRELGQSGQVHGRVPLDDSPGRHARGRGMIDLD